MEERPSLSGNNSDEKKSGMLSEKARKDLRLALKVSSKEAGTIRTLVGTTDDVLLFDNGLDEFPSTLLTIPEVAKFLKISLTGIRRLQQQRAISFIKVGGSVRFLKEDVLSYLRKQRVKSIE